MANIIALEMTGKLKMEGVGSNLVVTSVIIVCLLGLVVEQVSSLVATV